ncbi:MULTISPECIES: hypothetical protein [unclassified Streptomyces]|uniref:hypothetical protein n=1 Tax=unclassified Streptomyces TaxID=2593676 RepID=UPI002E2E1706|nr:hypothetical protein [Streptomyces sp. NBC_00223]
MLATLRIASLTLGTSATVAVTAACGALAVAAITGQHLVPRPAAVSSVDFERASAPIVPADFVWPVRAAHAAHAEFVRPSHALRVTPADFVWP